MKQQREIEKRKPAVFRLIGSALLVVTSLFLLSALGKYAATGVTDAAPAENPKRVDLPNVSGLASTLKPSVVYIVVSGDEQGPDQDLPEDHPKVPPEKQKGVGSGFIIDKTGLILTNDHVVEGSDKIEVVISKGKRYQAEVVGRDPQFDVALVKINPRERLVPVELGDSDKAKTGQWVVAMGNPFGLENNVTIGLISGKGRELPEAPFVDFIQTDAAIYPGNSGGPLVNLSGEVVGINTAVVPGTQLGFSIPINKVKDILPELKKGKVTRGFIGIEMAPVSDVPEKAADKKGVLVVSVSPGAAADKAGAREEDIIVEYDGKRVDSPNDLAKLVQKTRPGKEVKIKVERDSKKITLELKVGRSPNNR